MQGFGSWNQFLKTSNYPKTCHTNFPGAQNVSFSTLNSLCEVAQSCPTLCDPTDCSLPGSSVHGIFQARVLEWAAISFSRASSRPRDQTQVSCIAGRCFTLWATRANIKTYNILIRNTIKSEHKVKYTNNFLLLRNLFFHCLRMTHKQSSNFINWISATRIPNAIRTALFLMFMCLK